MFVKNKNKNKKKEEINKRKNLWKQNSLKMLDVFRGLKTLIKKSSVTIDSSIFRLHYSISGTDFVFLQFFDQSSQIFPHMREIAKYSAVAYFLDSLIAHDKKFSKRHFIISKAILCTTEASSIKHAQWISELGFMACLIFVNTSYHFCFSWV